MFTVFKIFRKNLRYFRSKYKNLFTVYDRYFSLVLTGYQSFHFFLKPGTRPMA